MACFFALWVPHILHVVTCSSYPGEDPCMKVIELSETKYARHTSYENHYIDNEIKKKRNIKDPLIHLEN